MWPDQVQGINKCMNDKNPDLFIPIQCVFLYMAMTGWI